MISLVVLLVCATCPWALCFALRAFTLEGAPSHAETSDRALARFRRAALYSAVVALPASAMVGALLVDPSLTARSPVAGSWFFSSLCGVTTWVNVSLAQRGPDEAAAMSHLETAGRALQMSAVPSIAVGLSLLSFAAAPALLPAMPAAAALLAALASVASVLVISPWLTMAMGLWKVFPTPFEANGESWRLAHLPAPTPFLTHVAALPWLRSVLISDGLFNRAPDRHWQALVQYEIAGALRSRADRAARWAVAIPLSVIVFVAAQADGASDPRKLVAATVLAVLFTATASWFANREPVSKVALDPNGPSMQELAQTLRSLPPYQGQAFPRTAHKPLGAALYNRLFALGHDPGPRPHR